LQLSRSTVKRALHDLIKAGLIEKEARFRENGSNTSNRFLIK
jgi:predicted transcriptional regulator